LVLGRLLAEGPSSFSLIDRECQEAQEQYYRAQERRAAPQDQPPSDQKQYPDNEHNHADVCAQHRMANAAEYGLLLLLLTLCFSAAAAIAAWRTVGVMRESSWRQLRAYVGPVDVEIKKTDTDSPFVVIAIRNAGASPAYKVTIRTGYFISFKDRSGDDFDGPNEKTVRGFDIGPGQTLYHPVYFSTFIWHIGKATLANDAGQLFIVGRIDYEDAFERQQWARFRFKYLGTGKDGVRDGKDFSITAEGNEST